MARRNIIDINVKEGVVVGHKKIILANQGAVSDGANLTNVQ